MQVDKELNKNCELHCKRNAIIVTNLNYMYLANNQTRISQ